MPTVDQAAVTSFTAKVWRDFALLVLQSLAIGLAASLVLGLACCALAT